LKASKGRVGIEMAGKGKTPAPAQDKCEALGTDELCRRILDGYTLTEIARGLEIARSRLIEWIGKDPDRSARVREARQTAAAAYEEQAMDHILSASDPFELAKARELAQHLRWRDSNINAKEYGDKQTLDVSGKLDVTLFDPEQAMEMAKLAYESKSR